jgi:hypothetical protein
MSHRCSRYAPHAAALVVLVLVVSACSAPADDGTDGTPIPTAVVGEIGGEVSSGGPVTGPAPSGGASAGETPTTGPTPAPTAAPTPPPTAVPTPPPVQPDGFTAVVRACASISGSTCNGEYGTMPAGRSTFTALVTFTDANAGDQISVTLAGPSGTIPGAPYTLQGGGDGYYYSIFQAGGLPAGSYTLSASRNGAEVAVTTFQIAGG